MSVRHVEVHVDSGSADLELTLRHNGGTFRTQLLQPGAAPAPTSNGGGGDGGPVVNSWRRAIDGRMQRQLRGEEENGSKHEFADHALAHILNLP